MSREKEHARTRIIRWEPIERTIKTQIKEFLGEATELIKEINSYKQKYDIRETNIIEAWDYYEKKIKILLNKYDQQEKIIKKETRKTTLKKIPGKNKQATNKKRRETLEERITRVYNNNKGKNNNEFKKELKRIEYETIEKVVGINLRKLLTEEGIKDTEIILTSIKEYLNKNGEFYKDMNTTLKSIEKENSMYSETANNTRIKLLITYSIRLERRINKRKDNIITITERVKKERDNVRKTFYELMNFNKQQYKINPQEKIIVYEGGKKPEGITPLKNFEGIVQIIENYKSLIKLKRTLQITEELKEKQEKALKEFKEIDYKTPMKERKQRIINHQQPRTPKITARKYLYR